ILVYVVPQKLLERAKVARYLAGHYDDKRAVRFPDGEHERFGQIVVFGRRRLRYKTPSGDEIEAVQRLAHMDLPPLKAVETPHYSVIPAPTRGANGRPVRYYRAAWSPEDMVAATRQIGVHTTQEWTDLHANGNGMVDIRPAMPLKKGHVAMLMSSGMMGTLRLSDEEGRPMLVKGRVAKVPQKVLEEIQTNKKGEKEEVIKWRDRFVTTVAALSKAGLSVIKDVVGLTKFMKAHGDKIANHILHAYKPLYNLTPTLAEQAVVDGLGTERKPLPGQAKAGLLPTQKHAAIAMARAIKSHGTGNLQGEMGLGKTTIGAAVADLLDAYPAIIICPPHLVPKWIREVQDVIPGAYARELRRIGRNGVDAGDVNDVQRFLDEHASGKISRKAVAVVASTSAKMGSGWKAAAPVARVVPEDPTKLARFQDALKAAKMARQAYRTASRTCGANAVEHLETLRQAAVRARREALELATPRKAVAAHTCPTCGQVQTRTVSGVEEAITGSRFEKKRRFCMAQVPGWELDVDGRLKRDDDGNTVWGWRDC
ncbi:MAG: DEAD/DEAH box helicase, partial [Delftia sp.]|nr:DEAD/DEAH box helicase [Delftia sp.]